MSGSRPLVWLASYPKSGNTWMRALLTAYFASSETMRLDTLIGGAAHLSRELMDDFCGVPSAELTWPEIGRTFNPFWRHYAERVSAPHFLKVHSCFEYDDRQKAIFPASVSKGAVTIVRNPLDITLSLAAQFSKSVDEAIGQMEQDYMYQQRGSPHLPERWASWSHNVTSWLDQSEIDTCLIRYEDMLADAITALRCVLEFCGITPDSQQLDDAVQAARFDALQSVEAESGFAEKAANQQSFFRQGTAGQWRDRLNRPQVERIVNVHGHAMDRFGYLKPALEFIEFGD